MENIYLCCTIGVVHSGWCVSLGVLAYIFKEIKRYAWRVYLKDVFDEVAREEVIKLRRVHQQACELLRDVNEIYSVQILVSLGCFFIVLAFHSFSFALNISNLDLLAYPWLGETIIVFCSYTLFAIILRADTCVMQVSHKVLKSTHILVTEIVISRLVPSSVFCSELL